METWNNYLRVFITSSAIGTVIINSPIHAVLFLVLTFVLRAIILLVHGLEVIALIFIAIYVGAIAVLFLVVVITLNLKRLKHKTTFNSYFLIIGIRGYISFHDSKFYTSFIESQSNAKMTVYNWSSQIDIIEPLHYYGQCLGTGSLINLFIVGLVLLVALFGCIILVNAVPTKVFTKLNTKVVKNHYQLVRQQISRRENTTRFLLRTS